jgi:hypothetical protein
MVVTRSATHDTFRGQLVLSINQLGRDDLETLFHAADEIGTADEHGILGTPLAGKVLVSAFFDTSTRTRLAHEAAMVRLGDGVIGFADTSVTRASGEVGEADLDVVRMLALCGDEVLLWSARATRPGVRQTKTTASGMRKRCRGDWCVRDLNPHARDESRFWGSIPKYWQLWFLTGESIRPHAA